MRILFDGWDLIHSPLSFTALHLLDVFECIHNDVDAWIALPGAKPDWLLPELVLENQPTPDTPYGRLKWQQVHLPRIAKKNQIDFIHSFGYGGILFGNRTLIISPTRVADGKKLINIFDRLSLSAGVGGLRSKDSVLWPGDLPISLAESGWQALCKLIPPLSITDYSGLGIASPVPQLPERYVLYHGPTSLEHVFHLLEIWSRVAGVIGLNTPLVVLGLKNAQRIWVQDLAQTHKFTEMICLPGEVTPVHLKQIYQQSAAVLMPHQEPAWGGTLRRALSFGIPVAGYESKATDAVAGPAAYLVADGDQQALAGALITLCIEENIEQGLREKAVLRSAGWDKSGFINAYLAVCKESMGL